jgi:hypothetical protein
MSKNLIEPPKILKDFNAAGMTSRQARMCKSKAWNWDSRKDGILSGDISLEMNHVSRVFDFIGDKNTLLLQIH